MLISNTSFISLALVSQYYYQARCNFHTYALISNIPQKNGAGCAFLGKISFMDIRKCLFVYLFAIKVQI